MKKIKIQAIAVGAIAVASLVAACTSDSRDPTLGETIADITKGAKRAAGAAACTDGMDKTANENDCLTIKADWAAAKAEQVKNAGMKPVYTGIDKTDEDDAPLITVETKFAQGFKTDGTHATGAVYGAHGLPGWIQGLANNNAGDSILSEKFGAKDIPMLGLSVCWAGNTGADARADQITGDPKTYVNNIPAATFITNFYAIPSSAIVACRNGVVRPSEDTLYCTQRKIRRDDAMVARVTGNAGLIQGDGTVRGWAVTKPTEDDATGDFSVTMQAAGPARYFKARNLSTKMPREGSDVVPWSLKERCACDDGICTIQDNYPLAMSSSIMETTTTVFGGAGYGSGGTTTESLFIMLFGRFLTTNIQIERPDHSFGSVLTPTATPDGSFATFTFVPTMPGVYLIHLTDLDNLQNDPTDPAHPFQQFFVDGNGTVISGGGGGSGSGCVPSCSGRTCGDDGCGGTCGICGPGLTCAPGGVCTGSGSGGGSGTLTCDHPVCVTGDALPAACEPCTQQICAADPFCCTSAWDSSCVAEVPSMCGQSCGLGSGVGSGSAVIVPGRGRR